jgi:ectoine hydroxylase-related dioxygenase (phytanoyl-CoA dioxygenase family)
VIPGSHHGQRLRAHRKNDSDDVTLNQELLASEFDEAQAADLVLKAGQMSLHDVYLLHGSEPNVSPRPRRGMTLRFMPTTSVFDREVAEAQAREFSQANHAQRTLYLMSGVDRSGRNDFRVRR